MSKNLYVENRPGWLKEYGDYAKQLNEIIVKLKIIEKYFPLSDRSKRWRILDYGCAFGYYLRYLKELNPHHQLYGVDVAKDAIQETAKVIGEDHCFWARSSESLPLEDKSMDIVYSFDMIEHVEDPDEITGFLNNMKRLLREDGLAFIATPNYTRPMNIIYRVFNKTDFLTSDHKTLFTAAKLRKLISTVGLEVVRTEYSLGRLSSRGKKFPRRQIRWILERLHLGYWFSVVIKHKEPPLE